jgi:hypothetical protein
MTLQAVDSTPAGSTPAFLSSRLRFAHDATGQEICMVQLDDGVEVGVMMGWERDISGYICLGIRWISLEPHSAKCRKRLAGYATTTRTGLRV